MIIIGVIFCLVLLAILGVFIILRHQTVSYVKLGTLYTNKFMSCEITLDEYTKKKQELRTGVSPLLAWYMRKEGILND